jgi:uncharacterized sporulation protein YeaH/YhbH (DUF444 family)
MPRKSKAELESMSAEAAWYATPEGRRQTQREFERALKRGTLLRSPGSPIPQTDAKVLAELVEKAKAKATKAISIRLPVADLERAQRIAAKEGIGYQTVLKRAIQAGLKKVS